MLTIRMQRTGRKGYATFRVVVQDSRFSPNSGRAVARIGHYNPHTKETVIDKEQVSNFLKKGAQPSPRVVRLLMAQKITLPSWVQKPSLDNKRSIKNPKKLRKNRPKENVISETVPTEVSEDSKAKTSQDKEPKEESKEEVLEEEKQQKEENPKSKEESKNKE